MSNDPCAVLGVALDATDEAIREAYLAKVKAFPPERAPEEFERIRDAFEALKDPRRRARLALFGVDPDAPLVALVEGYVPVRPYQGPDAWRAVLRDGGKR